MKDEVKVKICGVKTPQIARLAADYGADMLGLVFAESKRQVLIDKAQEIRKAVPELPLVGVFKDQELETIEKIIEKVGIDVVQLHGDEPVSFLQAIKLPVFRSIAVQTDGQFNFKLESWCGVEAFLFDSALPDGSSGGAGVTFDWRSLKKEDEKAKLIVAGGLNVDNVKTAIERLQPYAVDVSGGVEVNGEKSPELIKQFIEIVKRSNENA